METQNNYTINTPARLPVSAVNSLAIVGFIALIVAGILLAIYSTRFVPNVVNGVGNAAVYLGSIFVPNNEPALTIVPPSTASTTIFFGSPSNISTTTATTTVVKTPPVNTLPKPPKTPGPKTSATYPMGTSTVQGPLYGFSDLTANITAVGYLESASAESFVATTTIRAGMRPAVKFTIKNIGTNVTGSWRFSAIIPTQSLYNFQSTFQQSLAPGESIDYTLGFDQAIAGYGKMISVTSNFDHAVTESNFNNNSTSIQITVLGS